MTYDKAIQTSHINTRTSPPEADEVPSGGVGSSTIDEAELRAKLIKEIENEKTELDRQIAEEKRRAEEELEEERRRGNQIELLFLMISLTLEMQDCHRKL